MKYHHNIKQLWAQLTEDNILAWILDKLGQFQFEIKNEAEKNPNAECLSSVPTTTDEVVYQLEKAIDISNKIWEQAMKAFDLDLQKLKRKKFKK